MKGITVFIFSMVLPQIPGFFTEVNSSLTWHKTIPNKIELGELIQFPTPPPAQEKQIHFFIDEERMTFVPDKNEFMGTVSIYKKGQSLIKGYWKDKNSNWVRFQQLISVKKRPLHHASQLRIPASTWKKVDHRDQQTSDRKKMAQVWRESAPASRSSCFSSPLQSLEVSSFASPRTLPNGRSYYHTGVDLRARTGTEIKSIGQGRVVFADHLLVPGRVVVVDHGAGLFSRYMHLSEIDVHVGEIVSRQQTLGEAGATGRVEGSHLHWEVLWKGRPLDPKKFVQKRDCLSQQKLADSNH